MMPSRYKIISIRIETILPSRTPGDPWRQHPKWSTPYLICGMTGRTHPSTSQTWLDAFPTGLAKHGRNMTPSPLPGNPGDWFPSRLPATYTPSVRTVRCSSLLPFSRNRPEPAWHKKVDISQAAVYESRYSSLA